MHKYCTQLIRASNWPLKKLSVLIKTHHPLFGGEPRSEVIKLVIKQVRCANMPVINSPGSSSLARQQRSGSSLCIQGKLGEKIATGTLVDLVELLLGNELKSVNYPARIM